MLKLLKYEWKACARTCLPLYGVLILMSLISRILYVIPKNASLDFMLPAISSLSETATRPWSGWIPAVRATSCSRCRSR